MAESVSYSVKMASPPSYRTRELFGGALTATLPSNIIDASELRQVPDTQEVFVFPDSDLSIMFEILQIVQEGHAANDLQEAVRYHFKSIAHDNSAFSTTVDTVSSPFPLPSSLSSASPSSPASTSHLYTTLEGVQIVSKFNLPESESDLVKIFLGLIRVDLKQPSEADPSVNRGADITIAINVPLGKVADIDSSAGQLQGEVKELELKAKPWFQEAVQTFKVVDYGLFA